MKKYILLTLKFSLAILLIGWLIHQGKLDINQAAILVDNPPLLVFGVLAWLAGPLILGAYRWGNLLAITYCKISLKKLISLQWIGAFFNTALPGSVSGDIIKTYYAIKATPDSQDKSRAIVATIVDRIIGLYSVIIQGGAVALVFGGIFWENLPTRTLLGITLSLFIGMSILLFAIFKDKRKNGNRKSHQNQAAPSGNIFHRTSSAIRTFRGHYRAIIWLVIVSMIIQGINLAFFILVTKQLLPEVSIALLALVFPLGLILIAIPISPAGIGVGHLAFEYLLQLGGATGGANVFNVYILVTIVLNLSGALPYLITKERGKDQESLANLS